MTASVVDEFYDNVIKILNIIDERKETSLHIWTGDYLTRILVIVEANYFENEIAAIMKIFFDKNTSNQMVKSFVLNAMERKYYTYFNWSELKYQSANNFFILFGPDFKDKIDKDVKSNTELKESIVAFLEVGQTRNNLVHKQLQEVAIPKTALEYYELYKKALFFINYLKNNLK